MGEGPAFVKIGGHVAYRLEDVEAFEVANLRTSTTQVAAPAKPAEVRYDQ